MTGHIKFFNDAKGYGFLVCDDGKDYFFHFSGLVNPVQKGDLVSFELIEKRSGLQATKIRLV